MHNSRLAVLLGLGLVLELVLLVVEGTMFQLALMWQKMRLLHQSVMQVWP